MADCRFCCKPAGFLRHKHAECQKLHEKGQGEILDLIADGISRPELTGIPGEIDAIALRSFISDSEKHALCIQGWKTAVHSSLEDDLLSSEEETNLVTLRNALALDQTELDTDGTYSSVVKAGVLRDVMNGILPDRIKLDGDLPINFQKSEKLIWAFSSADYLEDKIRRSYVGTSHGVSMRIAKGVYYRTGSFRGHPVERTERVHLDSGVVAITNKHIYFSGPRKSLRVPYLKIVSFQPFTDGVGIVRDAASAKPQFFITGDGWFTYNLVSNLARL
jgi:hypothetical protein